MKLSGEQNCSWLNGHIFNIEDVESRNEVEKKSF